MISFAAALLPFQQSQVMEANERTFFYTIFKATTFKWCQNVIITKS